jgi:chaperonin cofactor prefoldin
MPESESTSNGHKKIRKTISAYKTLQKINEDQKSLKESGEVILKKQKKKLVTLKLTLKTN